MPRGLFEKVLDRVLDQVVDVNNFSLREPYKKIAVNTAKNVHKTVVTSKAFKAVEKEPSVAAIKQMFKRKLKPEQLADTTKFYDLYLVLGIDRFSDIDTVKKAFRGLASTHHPDKNPGNKMSPMIFKRLNQANEVLSNPIKKALYDEFGEISMQTGFDADLARRSGFGTG